MLHVVFIYDLSDETALISVQTAHFPVPSRLRNELYLTRLAGHVDGVWVRYAIASIHVRRILHVGETGKEKQKTKSIVVKVCRNRTVRGGGECDYFCTSRIPCVV